MKEFYCLWKAEFIKMKHSGIYRFHLLCPVLASTIFLAYYLSIEGAAGQSAFSRLSGLIQAVGILFPVVVSIVCAKGIELEANSHFQTLLGTAKNKINAFLAKWTALQVLALAAVAGTVALFAAGERLLFKNLEIPLAVYLAEAILLWTGSIPLYLEHLFLNLRFSKAVSMGVSVVQLLIAALFLTGLGDGIWQYFPSSWCARGSMTGLTRMLWPQARPQSSGQFSGGCGACVLIGLAICVIMLLWFYFYEGRVNED